MILSESINTVPNNAQSIFGYKPSSGGGGEETIIVAPESRGVIIDTDWWTDVDDAGALRCAAYAEQAGFIDIIAVVLSASEWYSAPSLSAFFNNDTDGELVIGNSPYGASTGSPSWQRNSLIYTDRTYVATDECEDAVSVYRRSLASLSEGEKCNIYILGYLNNLSDLLKSPADEISTKTGMELVTDKVEAVYIVGGVYPNGSENNFRRTESARIGANYVCANNPVPLIFLGAAVGSGVKTGQLLNQNIVTAGSFVNGTSYKITYVGDTDYTLIGANANIIGTSFTATGAGVGTGKAVPIDDAGILQQAYYDHGTWLNGNDSWDLMGVVLGYLKNPWANGYYVVRGSNSVDVVTGDNTFTPDVDGKDAYIVKNRDNSYWEEDINTILSKSNWRTDREDVGRIRLPRLPKSTNYYDYQNMIANWDFSNLSSYPDTTPIYMNSDVSSLKNDLVLRYEYEPREAPTKQTKSGLHCAKIDQNQRLITREAYTTPSSFTVYMKLLWDEVPSSRENLFSQDISSARAFHIKMDNATTLQVIKFNPTGLATGQVTIVPGQWHTIVAVYTPTSIKAYFDGSLVQSAFYTGTYTTDAQICLGSRYATSTIDEQSFANFNAVRMYSVAHDETQIANVLSEIG